MIHKVLESWGIGASYLRAFGRNLRAGGTGFCDLQLSIVKGVIAKKFKFFFLHVSIYRFCPSTELYKQNPTDAVGVNLMYILGRLFPQ